MKKTLRLLNLLIASSFFFGTIADAKEVPGTPGGTISFNCSASETVTGCLQRNDLDRSKVFSLSFYCGAAQVICKNVPSGSEFPTTALLCYNPLFGNQLENMILQFSSICTTDFGGGAATSIVGEACNSV